MSHIPQREEKDCLNCGAIVQGRYCQVCGQENTVPRETFWHMFTHFFYDVTHFDSKFFESVKDLVFRPGFLSREYVKGRRASYLHPIRMYVFTSAIFFLLFFSVFKPEVNSVKLTPKVRMEKLELFNNALGKDSNNYEFRNLIALLKDTNRTLTLNDVFTLSMESPLTADERMAYAGRLQAKIMIDKNNQNLKNKLAKAKDTSQVLLVKDTMDRKPALITYAGRYKTTQEYDSMEKELAPSRRDGWFMRRLIKKAISINSRYTDPNEAIQEFVESSLHRIPYMLFVSLPLFALLLKLVYVRRRQFFYADHGVFTIHLYVFSFLILLMIFSLTRLDDFVHFKLMWIPILTLVLWLFIYLYKAMRNFYGQRRAKTIFKFLFVASLSLLMMLVLLALFAFFSYYTL